MIMRLRTKVALGAAALALTVGGGVGAAAATTDYSHVRPGAYCAAADEGREGTTADGTKMVCSRTAEDTRLRWREAAPETPTPSPSSSSPTAVPTAEPPVTQAPNFTG
jgi:hypothetical protein